MEINKCRTQLLSRVETSPGIKDYFLVPGAVINRDKRSFFYLSPALDFRTGTKDFIGPGFNHSRDKCVGSKPCYVVVSVRWPSSFRN